MADRITPTTNIEDCHELIQKRARKIRVVADENDDKLRISESNDKYIQHLRWFDAYLKANDLEPDEVGRIECEEIGLTLSSEFSGATGLYKWHEIRKLYNYLRRRNVVDENPFELYDAEDLRNELGLTRTSEQDKQLENGEEYAVSQDEVRMMERARPKIRDQLIIRMLWQTGLRRGELSRLKTKDVDRDNREVVVREESAKNGQTRVVPYQHTLDGLLREWLDNGRRDSHLAGEDMDWIFVGVRGRGRLSGRRISEIVRDAAEDAGIQKKLYEDSRGGTRYKITAHNLRHGYGNYMVHETDAPIYEVSRLLGHNSVGVTEDIYLEDDERAGVDVGHKYGPE